MLGTHRGARAFTVGQRKGLAIGRPAPDGKPRFVLEIHPKTNEVVVGPKEMLAVEEILGIRQSWAGRPVPEAQAFLHWAAENHFTFLGYREYHLERDGDCEVLVAVPGTGFGILRADPGKPAPLPPLYPR